MSGAGGWPVGPAAPEEAGEIQALLKAASGETSLFQRPLKEIERRVGIFLVARSAGNLIGCAALEPGPRGTAELASLAVSREHRRRGIGAALVAACEARASAEGFNSVWLATAQPEYFSRLGYAPFPRLSLPPGVWLAKAGKTFAQPPSRWLGLLVARFTFMRKRMSSGGSASTI